MVFRGFVRPTLFAAVALIAASCGRKQEPPSTPRSAAAFIPGYLQPTAVGAPVEGRPWVAHVNPVDLDRDGLIDILACEAQRNEVVWIRQVARGQFEEQPLARGISAPVHVEAADIDADGDLDLLVASMGIVFPNNQKIGSIIALENDGRQNFSRHVLGENIPRVTDVRAADFNGDGRIDLAVAQFGYVQGEVRWMENLGDWKFKPHLLLNLSGAINVLVADFNGDRTSDIATVISQEWEEVHLFENDGRGSFTDRVIFGSTNEDFGSSGITLCDLNRDERSDILLSNGDGFDYAEPGARPWHGVQWLENLGGGKFRQQRIGDLPGAYSPVAVDLDRDGALDVVAVSGFNEWRNANAASLVVFHNDGRMNFTRHVLAHVPTHLLTAAAADFDGTGQPLLVTGGFHAYPPWDNLSRIILWRASK